MKRKIFSKLLMGAFLFASVSAFVSCKDYDDDINANKADIKAVQEQLSTLTSNLNSLQTQLQAQKTALEQELATAKSQLETQIASAKAELNAAIEKKADQATVDALATRVATLETNLAALKSAYEAKIATIDATLVDLKTTVQNLQANKADVTYVDQAIATLQTALEGKIALINGALDGKVGKDEFAAFKNDVKDLENALANLTILANSKADQKDIDHAVEKINESIAALQKQMETVVPQTALEKMSETINGLKESIAAIQTSINTLNGTVAGKANQTALDELSRIVDNNYKELKAQVNALVTPEMLAEAVKTLQDEIAKKDEAQTAALKAEVDKINALIELINAALDTKANATDVAKAVEDLTAAINTKADDAAFKKAVEDLTAAIDTKANAADVNKAISEILEALDTKANDSEFKKAVEDINTELGTKANIEDVAAALELMDKAKVNLVDYTEKMAAIDGDIDKANKFIAQVQEDLNGELDLVNGKLRDHDIALAALILQAAAVDAFLGDYEDGTLAETLAALKSEMSQDAQDKVDAEAKARAEAIEDVNDQINATQLLLLGLIEKLYGDGEEGEDAVIGDIAKMQAEFEEVKTQFGELDESVQNIDENLSNLAVFVNKMLTSVTLIPQLYIDGIEAIEFKTLVYTPQKHVADYWATFHQQQEIKVNIQGIGGAKEVRVDNKQTIALYRLSPKNVDLESFDITNLSFVSNVAKSIPTVTRATVGPEATSLVSVDKAEVAKVGSENHLKVYLKKNDIETQLEGDLDDDQIRTVSLKVPRGADYVAEDQPADVYSEYSRIVETTFTPKIAAVPFTAHNWHGWKQHYSSYGEIYNTLIDAKDRVTKEVYYKDDFDLLRLVTGDYDATVAATTHTQITKDELKAYGLAFRFSIPEQAYNDVTHSTDQQQFAKLSGATGDDGKPLNNIISSKLPDDPIYGNDNEATVGKEPIVCVQLVDTVNNYNLVDERYLKIKWVNKKLPDVEIDPFEDEFVLSCDDETSELTWKWVINKVYGKITDENGNIVGMSQSRFETNYPIDKMKWAPVSDARYVNDVKTFVANGDLLPLKKLVNNQYDGISPFSHNTTNANGDAILAKWTISNDEIGTLGANGREFKVKVYFESADPGRYPNLYFIWTVKFTLPEYNAYVAKNTINWATDDPTIMWVYPVQYNTSTAGGRVKFEYNLMASFTRPASGNDLWIVRSLTGDCPAWDIQFSTQPNQDKLIALGDPLKSYDVTYHRAHTTWNQPLKPYIWGDDSKHSQIVPLEAYSYALNQLLNNTTTKPTKQVLNDGTASAYVFNNEAGAEVLNIAWGGSHPADNWAGEDGTTKAVAATATLNGNNATIYPLLNQLSDDNEADQITPKKTHTKLVKMNVWAKLNPWNYYEVNNSPFYLAIVEPIRVNANIEDYFVDNIAGGSRIGVGQGLTMTDFAGYIVRRTPFSQAEIADAPKVGSKESCKAWAPQLYRYYGIQGIEWDVDHVTYGLKLDAGQNLVADPSITVANAINGKTAQWVFDTTTGGVDPSITYDAIRDELVFKNLGGQHVGFDYNVFVPVKVTYALGTLTRYVKVVVHPAGYAPAGARKK